METRTKNEAVGTHLTFDQSGIIKSERKIARQVGTTVTIEKLFSTMPVRSKEFSRNIRREFGKLVSLLNVRKLYSRISCEFFSGCIPKFLFVSFSNFLVHLQGAT